TVGAQRVPRYCFLVSMHYNTTTLTDEVVAETRQWLDRGSDTHGFMQCEATVVFENDANGHFLSYHGISKNGAKPLSVTNRQWHKTLAQLDGNFLADDGAIDVFDVTAPQNNDPEQREVKDGVTTLINDSTSSS